MGFHRAFSNGHRAVPTLLAPAIGALLMILSPASWAGASRSGFYEYVSPVPGSRGNSPWNNIVLREGRMIDRASLDHLAVFVTGSKSGRHLGSLVLSDDDRTLVFNPDQPFSLDETVTVRLEPDAPDLLPRVGFSFSVSTTDPKRHRHADPEEAPEAVSPTLHSSGPASPAAVLNDLPATYPEITLLASSNPDSGYVFCTPVNRTTGQNRNMLILDNYAMPIFYRNPANRPIDFKKLEDGRLVFFDLAARQYYAMDTFYAYVDSFKMGNGYVTDFHDIEMLPDNHALLMAYDPQAVDMSLIVPGGNPDAIVTGLIIQEIDAAKNVVFQWRSWDHFQITDMHDCHSLLGPTVDYVHGNSLESDFDGHILVSCRYLDEITKINRQTGDIIWRFGKNSRNNQFTILDDSLGFSDQHDARRLPNGHITLYDNHNCIDPKNSRALEYEIDEQSMIARLVGEYRHTPDQSATATGNVQRRTSGGTMIGWGNVPTPPNVTDIHPDGSIAWEVQFWPPPTLSASYRAFRFPWRATVFTPNVDDLDFGAVALGDSALMPLTVTNNSASDVTLTSFVSLDAAFSVQEGVPLTIPAGGSTTVNAKFRPDGIGDVASRLYVRSATSTQVIAYPVSVHGSSYGPAAVLMALMEAGWVEQGVEVRWQFVATATIVASAVERSESASGPWAAVDGDRRQDGEIQVLLDRSAVAGRSYYYRILGTTAGGMSVVSNPVGVTSTVQLSVAPTPTRGATQIAYSVPRAAQIRLAVLDAQGRLVTVLASGLVPAGHYRTVWDAQRRGGLAPAGLYFVRLEGLGEPVVRRLVIAR